MIVRQNPKPGLQGHRSLCQPRPRDAKAVRKSTKAGQKRLPPPRRSRRVVVVEQQLESAVHCGGPLAVAWTVTALSVVCIRAVRTSLASNADQRRPPPRRGGRTDVETRRWSAARLQINIGW